MDIYVGNLSFRANEDSIRELFTPFGEVTRAQIITDKDSGRSRGFAFVSMSSDADAKKAIEHLNGSKYMDRVLTVNEAKQKSSSSNNRSKGRRDYR